MGVYRRKTYTCNRKFECTDEPSIKYYLIEEALDFHVMNLARTKLFFDRENNLVGFLTLYNDMMQIGRKKRRKHGMSQLPSYKWYPAIKLHYMGVDSRFRNRGTDAIFYCLL